MFIERAGFHDERLLETKFARQIAAWLKAIQSPREELGRGDIAEQRAPSFRPGSLGRNVKGGSLGEATVVLARTCAARMCSEEIVRGIAKSFHKESVFEDLRG